jgi:hypothetical protein
MTAFTYTMRSKVWADQQVAGWHFVTLPKKQSAEIYRLFEASKKARRPIPVLATVGRTSWKSSLYRIPDSGRYVLALRSDVRKKEGIQAGRVISYTIRVTT